MNWRFGNPVPNGSLLERKRMQKERGIHPVDPLDEEGTFSRRSDDVVIKFPFGAEVKASGRSVVLILIAFAIIASVVWHDYKSTQQNTAVVEALQSVSFLLTLSEKERKQLNLAMPESLRQKLEKENQHGPVR